MRRTAVLVWLVALLLALLPVAAGVGSPMEAGPVEPGRIAYIGTDGNVWTMLANGADKTRLTASGNTHGPRWSHDGGRIAYAAGTHSSSSSLAEVHVMDCDGENDRTVYSLLRLGQGEISVYATVDWLPDGRLLVETSVTKAGGGPDCIVAPEGLEEHIQGDGRPWDAVCLEEATIVHARRKRVSQSGVIVHETYELTPEPLDPGYWTHCVGIEARSSIEGAAQHVTDGCGNPSPSQDGAKVAYAYQDQVRVVDMDGKNDHLVYGGLQYDPRSHYKVWVDWSPSGSHIVLSGLDGIYLMPVDGSAPPIKLTDGSDPDWQPCGQGSTGLNTCDLEVGDILLSHDLGGMYAFENLLFQGYWTHAGIYNGCGKITESYGTKDCDSWWKVWTCLSDEPGVVTKDIEDSGFWSASDWAILRAKSNGGKRDAAVTYAKAQEGKKYNWNYPDKWTTDKFYCSQLVWRAYKEQDIDLDSNRGAINALTKWVGPWGVADAAGVIAAVPPDDIYFDDDVTVIKQRPGIAAALRRAVLRVLSPAHLYVTDPEGRHTGVDPNTGEVVEEIPGVFYSGTDAEPEFLSIEDMTGAWQVQVVGTDEGSYTLQVENVEAENHRLTEVAGEAREGAVTIYEAGHLASGWNTRCYVGEQKPVGEALAEIIESVIAVYRLEPDQTFGRWFPQRPDVSTISELNPYDQLFVLTSSSTDWVQEATGTKQTELDLVQGWNSICYTGEAKPVAEALSGLSGAVPVLYRLGENQAWARYVPDRPEVSNMAQLKRLDGVLMLVTQPGGARWEFEP